jgi:hypothetical protein
MARTGHPLQRLASPSRSISALIHLLGIASFSASFRWLFLYPSPENEKFGGVFQFLTIIGLALSLTSMALGLLADVTLSTTLFRAKNVISVCSTPLEVLISILYWGITLIDKRLLVPEEYQLPFWPDFGFHASKPLFQCTMTVPCVRGDCSWLYQPMPGKPGVGPCTGHLSRPLPTLGNFPMVFSWLTSIL